MAKVESFTLDHTKVKAPYVRLITVEEGPKGDKISNYDLRLVQPIRMQFQLVDFIRLSTFSLVCFAIVWMV